MLHVVSTFKEMLVAQLKVLCQNSPEEAEEYDENCVRITDNAVDIRSQCLPKEIQGPFRLRQYHVSYCTSNAGISK